MIGDAYSSHYNYILRNHLKTLYVQLELEIPSVLLLWRNGNSFEPSSSRCGIASIAVLSRNDYKMLPLVVKPKVNRHQYVASQQQTLFAVLPICTKEERQLFRSLMRDLGSSTTPNFLQLARAFNDRADGQRIFYKLKEHIELYHKKIYQLIRFRESTLFQCTEAAVALRQALRSPIRAPIILPPAAPLPIPPPIIHPEVEIEVVEDVEFVAGIHGSEL
jgi:hypothetical protein